MAFIGHPAMLFNACTLAPLGEGNNPSKTFISCIVQKLFPSETGSGRTLLDALHHSS